MWLVADTNVYLELKCVIDGYYFLRLKLSSCTAGGGAARVAITSSSVLIFYSRLTINLNFETDRKTINMSYIEIIRNREGEQAAPTTHEWVGLCGSLLCHHTYCPLFSFLLCQSTAQLTLKHALTPSYFNFLRDQGQSSRPAQGRGRLCRLLRWAQLNVRRSNAAAVRLISTARPTVVVFHVMRTTCAAPNTAG